jgi:hypothetical protein
MDPENTVYERDLKPYSLKFLGKYLRGEVSQ